MPVHLRPEERAALPDLDNEDEEEQEEVSLSPEEMWGVARPCLVWMIVFAAPLIVGLTLLKPTLIAMERMSLIGEDSRSLTPLAFFILYGGGLGYLLASRLSLGDVLIWVAAGITAFLVAAIGGIYAFSLFNGRVPSTCWIALTVMAGAAIAGAVFHTKWSS